MRKPLCGAPFSASVQFNVEYGTEIYAPLSTDLAGVLLNLSRVSWRDGMARYSLRLVDPTDTVCSVFVCECPDDGSAIEIGNSLPSEGAVEVWSDRGMVARVVLNDQGPASNPHSRFHS
jgi:hypothetical protein